MTTTDGLLTVRDLSLRPLAVADELEAARAHDELAADGFTFLLGPFGEVPWPRYVAALERQRHGQDLPDGFVPSTFLVADVGGLLVGRASIRHELNDWLLGWGGHIGYAVRPAFRRRGLATAILRRSVDVVAGLGVDRVLVTCDQGNAASAAVIERCGGVLENVLDDPAGGAPKCRYWITPRGPDPSRR